MKKIISVLLLTVLIFSLTGCSQKSAGIKACDGYFDISAEDFLTKVNTKIQGNNGKYPALPDYTKKEDNGNLTEYYSVYDSGAYLRVSENKQHKVVMATILLDIAKATKSGANNSGYYFGTIGNTIDPDMKDSFSNIKETNLAVDDVQSTSEDNLFCVAVNENGVSQYRIYPLAKH